MMVPRMVPRSCAKPRSAAESHIPSTRRRKNIDQLPSAVLEPAVGLLHVERAARNVFQVPPAPVFAAKILVCFLAVRYAKFLCVPFDAMAHTQRDVRQLESLNERTGIGKITAWLFARAHAGHPVLVH